VTTGSNNLTGNYVTGAVANFTNTDGVDAAPLFVNIVGGNFRLRSSGPAIDVGVNLGSPYNIDYSGRDQDAHGPWDIGALVGLRGVSGEWANIFFKF
jgi:hypothetical protein